MIDATYEKLATAIIIQAVKDYCHARRTYTPYNYQAKSTIIEVDRFFRESYIPYIVLANPSAWWDDIKERLRLNKFIMRSCSDLC